MKSNNKFNNGLGMRWSEQMQAVTIVKYISPLLHILNIILIFKIYLIKNFNDGILINDYYFMLLVIAIIIINLYYAINLSKINHACQYEDNKILSFEMCIAQKSLYPSLFFSGGFGYNQKTIMPTATKLLIKSEDSCYKTKYVAELIKPLYRNGRVIFLNVVFISFGAIIMNDNFASTPSSSLAYLLIGKNMFFNVIINYGICLGFIYSFCNFSFLFLVKFLIKE